MKDDTNKVKAYFLITASDYTQYDDRVLSALTQAKALAKKLIFWDGMARADIAIARWYTRNADYIKALDHARQASDETKKGSGKYLPYTLSTIADAYTGLGNFDKMMEYHKQVLQLYQQTGRAEEMCQEYGFIATGCDNLKKYTTALFYHKQALAMVEKFNFTDLKSTIYGNLGWHYYLTKNYLPAYQYSLKSIKIDGEDNLAAASVQGTLGDIYQEAPDSVLIKIGIRPNERYQKALERFEKALAGDQKTHFALSLSDDYRGISACYAKLGNYKEAFDAYKNHILYRDSVTNEAQRRMIMQTEAQSSEESFKYQQRLTIGGIVVLLLISLIVLRNYYVQRRLKRRSDDLLNNILPADVAEELKEKGSSEARLFDEVTVLFTDFVNFTHLSELLTPKELVNELHHCFKAFDEIMATHSIEKIKTIGDAYLAVAGLPNADINHAANAIKAAQDIQQFIHARKSELGDKTFDIRIGIHSGSVVAGIVGVKKFAYDIWGDTVNTAARMEQNSEPGKTNVSEKTYELVKDQFEFTYRGEIEAKNKGALKMYFVN